MALLAAPKRNLKASVMTFSDGTGTPNTITIKMDDGNFTHQTGYNNEYILDRGNLDTVREGDDIPLQVTCVGRFTEITSSTGLDESPYEFATQSGAASTHLSTGAACEPYAFDIILTTTRPGCDDATDEVEIETETYSDFRPDTIDVDNQAGTITFTGRCNVVLPTSARTANP